MLHCDERASAWRWKIDDGIQTVFPFRIRLCKMFLLSIKISYSNKTGIKKILNIRLPRRYKRTTKSNCPKKPFKMIPIDSKKDSYFLDSFASNWDYKTHKKVLVIKDSRKLNQAVVKISPGKRIQDNDRAVEKKM